MALVAIAQLHTTQWDEARGNKSSSQLKRMRTCRDKNCTSGTTRVKIRVMAMRGNVQLEFVSHSYKGFIAANRALWRWLVMDRTWKWTILACAILATIICILNISVAIWATSRKQRTDEGNYVIKSGSCHSVSRSNIIIHLFINILSMLLLASSNFCMQVAIAPTRAEVDLAHARRKWLDIGTPSLGNLRHVSRSRVICWILLSISSIPLHLVYNSTVFATSVVTEYLVTEMDASYLRTGSQTRLENATSLHAGGNFRPGQDPNDITRTFEKILSESISWTNLTVEECAKAYSPSLITSHRTLVLVVEPSTTQRQLPGIWRVVGTPTWMCDDPPDVLAPDRLDANGTPGFPCEPTRAEFGLRTDDQRTPGRTMYCLSEPFEQNCTLEVSLALLITTILANAAKAATMLYLLLVMKATTLANICDALQSFLERAEEHTRGLSAWDAKEIKELWYAPIGNRPAPITWTPRSHRRLNAVSGVRLYVTFSLFFVALASIGVLFGMAVRADAARGVLHKSLSSSGILSKDVFAIIGFEALAGATLSGVVLLVNTPQLVLSTLYFFFNSLCTSFMEAQEWNDLASAHKLLRVSSSVSKASRFWLSLPPLYSISLMVFSAVLHWLVSQAIFMTKIRFLNFAGGPSERFGGGESRPGELLAASYSTGAILLCFLMSFVMVSGLLLVGAQKLRNQMTLVSSCSAAIAAACHYGMNEGDDANDRLDTPSAKPIQWGDAGGYVPLSANAEQTESSQTHVGMIRSLRLSTGNVTPPKNGHLYW
ncbi:hypothetical protein BKA66DRAFT_448311 [Pyrenochaeta sp. MPI-SDFR-AT-0127]|nr:hypothetical protein BKA66DRAFT_448311 [Pyrenochaeta sp. MPI-SDFR-AT-0127]